MQHIHFSHPSTQMLMVSSLRQLRLSRHIWPSMSFGLLLFFLSAAVVQSTLGAALATNTTVTQTTSSSYECVSNTTSISAIPPSPFTTATVTNLAECQHACDLEKWCAGILWIHDTMVCDLFPIETTQRSPSVVKAGPAAFFCRRANFSAPCGPIPRVDSDSGEELNSTSSNIDIVLPFFNITSQQCQELSECLPGSYISTNATSISDRVCSLCPPSTFQSNSNQFECIVVHACKQGFVTLEDPTKSSDRMCVHSPLDISFALNISIISGKSGVSSDVATALSPFTSNSSMIYKAILQSLSLFSGSPPNTIALHDFRFPSTLSIARRKIFRRGPSSTNSTNGLLYCNVTFLTTQDMVKVATAISNGDFAVLYNGTLLFGNPSSLSTSLSAASYSASTTTCPCSCNNNNGFWIIVVAALGGLCVVVLVILVITCIILKKKEKDHPAENVHVHSGWWDPGALQIDRKRENPIFDSKLFVTDGTLTVCMHFYCVLNKPTYKKSLVYYDKKCG